MPNEAVDWADLEPATAFRDVVVIGGGCYGTFYANQLASARAKGKLEYREVVLVDRNSDCQASRELGPRADRRLEIAEWGEFLDRFLARPAPTAGQPDDAIVPSPLMPHLLAEWLLRVARARWPSRSIGFTAALEPVGTPYDVLGKDGVRYVSFADWICPTHCVEPFLCPVIRGPRTWEMREAIGDHVRRLDRSRSTVGPALFLVRHRAFGVGMFDGAETRLALEQLDAAAHRSPPTDLVVATVSSCHGAMGILHFE